MTYVLACLAAAAMGVEGGWQPREGGGMEYIIQIEPEALEGLLDGNEIRSTVPSFVQDVRGYRVRIGKGEVPRINAEPAKPGEPTPAKPKSGASRASAKPGEQPGDGPTLAAPTFRGQDPTESEEAAARARRFNDRYADEPGKLNEPTPAAEDDFGTDFSSAKKNPFADKGTSRVTKAEYREDDPVPPPRSSAGRATSTTKPRTGATSTRTTRSALDDEPETKPAGKPTKTGAAGGSTSKPSGTTRTTRTTAAKEDEETASQEKPWFAFTMLVLALFASLGGNWYLGWMNWDLRNKYQRALNDRKWRREDYEPSARVA